MNLKKLPIDIINIIKSYICNIDYKNEVSNNFIIIVNTNMMIDRQLERIINKHILNKLCKLRIETGSSISKRHLYNLYEMRFSVFMHHQHINSKKIAQILHNTMIGIIKNISIITYDNLLFKYDYYYYYLQRGLLLNTKSMYRFNKFSYKKILEDSIYWGWNDYPPLIQ